MTTRTLIRQASILGAEPTDLLIVDGVITEIGPEAGSASGSG